jgi:DNA adenine methylase
MTDTPAPKEVQKEGTPFIKWMGGKTQLLTTLDTYLPQRIRDGHYQTYAEPFVGGGSFLLHMLRTYSFPNVIVNDFNTELYLTYTAIQQRPAELIRALSALQETYLLSTEEGQETMYYRIRTEYNTLKTLPQNLSEDEALLIAAYFIFLNKTCFNGLYRVNKKNLFNASFAFSRNPYFYGEDNIYAVSELLRNVILLNGDYTIVTPHLTGSTFLYLDPPYRPVSRTGHTKFYTGNPFDDDGQKRLATWVKELVATGNVDMMMSNSDPTVADPDDDFFTTLYADYTINSVQANRVINTNGAGRGKISELVITNY